MDEHRAIEFFAATNDGTAIDSWHWLLEWTTTSFYVKSMNPAMQAAKVSIHGPDPRHPGKHHFRFDIERTNQDRAARAVKAGARWLTDPPTSRAEFTGQPVNDDAVLLVRFCMAHDAFMAGAPAAGGSDWPKEKATMKGIVPVPTEGRVTHIDAFLSYNGAPYWPDEEATRAARAGIGYMKNSLGWCLSVVGYNRPDTDENNPCRDFRGQTPVDRCFRGIAAVIDDEEGFLWLCETLVPRVAASE
jgi:hypothetical protein